MACSIPREASDNRKSGAPEPAVQVYLCSPHSPWDGGSNETTNALLRQYFPKGTNLSAITVGELDAEARSVNRRPHKTLGWKEPAEACAQTVALTP
jgi:IS30 family transposase